MGNIENIIVLVPLRTSQTPDIGVPASHQGLEGGNQPRWDAAVISAVPLKQDLKASLVTLMPSPAQRQVRKFAKGDAPWYILQLNVSRSATSWLAYYLSAIQTLWMLCGFNLSTYFQINR